LLKGEINHGLVTRVVAMLLLPGCAADSIWCPDVPGESDVNSQLSTLT